MLRAIKRTLLRSHTDVVACVRAALLLHDARSCQTWPARGSTGAPSEDFYDTSIEHYASLPLRKLSLAEVCSFRAFSRCCASCDDVLATACYAPVQMLRQGLKYQEGKVEDSLLESANLVRQEVLILPGSSLTFSSFATLGTMPHRLACAASTETSQEDAGPAVPAAPGCHKSLCATSVQHVLPCVRNATGCSSSDNHGGKQAIHSLAGVSTRAARYVHTCNDRLPL
jgi:hypothetical protein